MDEDPGKMRELEIIFSDTNATQYFAQLKSLQKLSLIDTRLSRVPNLRCLGATLRSLTLSRQPHLQRLEFLDVLPNLTELFITRCDVTKIENLDRCPRLRRLWLSENRIDCIENLENLSDLREFCAQGNNIRELGGLEGNMYLRILDLSRNKISRLKELERLASLPELRELHLQSQLFGACPIVYQENYRSYTVCVLKGLFVLDGDRVEDRDRARAEDTFLQRQLEFHDQVDDLHRQHQEELRSIELARVKSIHEAEDLKTQLLEQFAKLQEVVSKGREKVYSERMRQVRLRDQNFEYLKIELLKARKQHRDILEGLIADERVIMEQEEKAFAHLSRRARLELNESIALAELMQGISDDDGTVIKRVAVQILYGDSTSAPSTATLPPELHALAKSILTSQQDVYKDSDQGGSSSKGIYRIYRAVKVFNAFLWREHWNKQDIATPTRTVYVGIPDLPILKRALTHGMEALGSYIWFSTNPRIAARHSGAAADMRGMYRVLQCTLFFDIAQDVMDVPEGFDAEPESILSNDRPIVRVSECLYLLQSQHAALLAPNVYLVLSSLELPEVDPTTALAHDPGLEQLVQTIRDKLTRNTDGVPAKVEEKLSKLEEKVQTVLAQYEDRVFNQLDPETASRIEAVDERAAQLHNQVINVRADIDLQKHKQEQILQSSV